MKPHVTLIFPSSDFLLNQAVFPPLGIMYLASFLKQYYINVQCLDFGIGHTLDMVEADIVGISITTPQRAEAFTIAEALRGMGKTLIAGGPHATHMPQECKDHGFHYVIKGEGEVELTQLLGDLLMDYSWRGPTKLDMVTGPEHIDGYPFPDREALPVKDYVYEIDGKRATVLMTSRGCPFDCSYCARITKTFRAQSSKRTIREIEFINTKYGFEAFMIFDDVFIAKKKRLREMADHLSAHNFTFRCFGRTDLITEDVCKQLKKMGVVEVGLGVESGSDAVLSKNMKGSTVEMNTRAVWMLHDHGIRAKAFLIVGLPGETPDTVQQTRDWIEKARPYDIDASVFQPLPGSRIFEHPGKWGINFAYDGKPYWYKGKPGEYEANISTEGLSSQEIVAYRDDLEAEFKRPENLK